MRRGIMPGIVLLLVGLYMLLGQFFILPDGLGLVFLGAFFLIMRGLKKNYGFTIAGSITLLLGIAELLGDLGFDPLVLQGSLQLFALAIGFFIIHIIEHNRIGNWPMIPAICLTIVGAAIVVFQYPAFYTLASYWLPRLWPVGLIVAGGVFLIKAAMRGRRQPPMQSPEEEQHNP